MERTILWGSIGNIRGYIGVMEKWDLLEFCGY